MEGTKKSDIQEDISHILSDFDDFLDNVFKSHSSSLRVDDSLPPAHGKEASSSNPPPAAASSPINIRNHSQSTSVSHQNQPVAKSVPSPETTCGLVDLSESVTVVGVNSSRNSLKVDKKSKAITDNTTAKLIAESTNEFVNTHNVDETGCSKSEDALPNSRPSVSVAVGNQKSVRNILTKSWEKLNLIGKSKEKCSVISGIQPASEKESKLGHICLRESSIDTVAKENSGTTNKLLEKNYNDQSCDKISALQKLLANSYKFPESDKAKSGKSVHKPSKERISQPILANTTVNLHSLKTSQIANNQESETEQPRGSSTGEFDLSGVRDHRLKSRNSNMTSKLKRMDREHFSVDNSQLNKFDVLIKEFTRKPRLEALRTDSSTELVVTPTVAITSSPGTLYTLTKDDAISKNKNVKNLVYPDQEINSKKPASAGNTTVCKFLKKPELPKIANATPAEGSSKINSLWVSAVPTPYNATIFRNLNVGKQGKEVRTVLNFPRPLEVKGEALSEKEENILLAYLHNLLSTHSAKIGSGIMSVEHRGTKALELWTRRVTEGYPGVNISNMTTSWRDGLAFCALIHHFRPDLIDPKSLKSENILENNALAFRVAEQHLGIPALLDAEDMVQTEVPDRLSILTYVSQFYQAFSALGLIGPGGRRSPVVANSKHNGESVSSPAQKTPPVVVPPRAKSISQPPPTLQTKTEQPGFKTDKATAVARGRREECVACHKTVFLAERMVVGFPGQLRHRTCFRCDRCFTQLTLSSYYETEKGQFCCETCPDEERAVSYEGEATDVLQSASPSQAQYSSSDYQSDSDSAAASESNEDSSSLAPTTLPAVTGRSRTPTPPLPPTPRTIFLKSSLESPQLSAPSKPPRSATQLTPSTHFSRQSPALCGTNSLSPTEIINKSDSSGFTPCDSKTQGALPPALDTGQHTKSSVTVESRRKVFEVPSLSKSRPKIPEDDSTKMKLNLTGEKKFIQLKKRFETPPTDTQVSEVHTAKDLPDPDSSPLTKVTERKSISPDSASNLVTSCPNNEEPDIVSEDTFSSPDANGKKAGYLIAQTVKLFQGEDNKLSFDADSNKTVDGNEDICKREKGKEEENETTEENKPEVAIDIRTSANFIEDFERVERHDEIKNNIDEVTLKDDTVKKKCMEDSIIEQVSLDSETNALEVKIYEAKTKTILREDSKMSKEEDLEEQVDAKLGRRVDLKNGENLHKIDLVSKSPKSGVMEINRNEQFSHENEINDRMKTAKTDAKNTVTDSAKSPYPVELNPFGSDDDEAEVTSPTPVTDLVSSYSPSVSKRTEQRTVLITPTLANPFDTDEETNDETSSFKISETPANKSLNPFGSDEEEESDYCSVVSSNIKSKIKPPRPPPPTLKRDATPLTKKLILPMHPCDPVSSPPSPTPSARSSSSDQMTLRLKKKMRQAPAPPPTLSGPSKDDRSFIVENEDCAPHGGVKDEDLTVKMQKDIKNHTNKMMLKNGVAVPKSESGEWKRKKGPAPLRPVPQKRAIRKLSMRQVQQELVDIDVKQTELERQGVLLETAIRDRTERGVTPCGSVESCSVQSFSSNSEADNSCSSNSCYPGMEVEDMILQLFELVNEKNELFRRQTELMYMKREKLLEEQYVELEYQIRCLMLKSPSEKNEKHIKQEEDLISRLVKVVEQRDAVVNCLEMERQREAIENESIATHMIKYQEKHIEGIDSDDDKSVSRKKKKKLRLLKKKKKKGKEKEKSSKIDADKDVDETEVKKKNKNWFKKPAPSSSDFTRRFDQESSCK